MTGGYLEGGTLATQFDGWEEARKVEPVKRLSLNLRESLHRRFKSACSATNRKMATELQELVTRRTAELEHEAGLPGAGGAATEERGATLSATAARRLAAVERALTCNHPTADIDKMLMDIDRGRDLR